MSVFDINNTFIVVWSYSLSYIEFVGTVAGVVAVWLATKQKLISWPIGIVNVLCFMIMNYQVQLYWGVFLQAFYLVSNLYGWYYWRKQAGSRQVISKLTNFWRMVMLMFVLLLAVVAGYGIQLLPALFPALFSYPPSYPYFDALIAIASIVGQLLLTRRNSDTWFVWMVVNVFSVYVYYQQGLYFVTFVYVVFLILSIKGMFDWERAYDKAQSSL